MSEHKHVQIISCGPGLSPINSQYGKSSDWVKDIIKDKVSNINIVKAYEKEVPAFNSDTIWIIMGSRYSVYDQTEWIHVFKQHIQEGVKNGIPMLGICFGHQILCNVLGGEVANNPKGWEIGSSNVGLTEKGKESNLFKDFSLEFSVYESHHDAVVNIPSNIDILGQNKYGIQAFSYSDFIFGVQFHPEFNFDVMKAYYSIRIKKVENKSDYHVCDKNEGIKVVDNFINMNLRR